jgi:hypothetical protein
MREGEERRGREERQNEETDKGFEGGDGFRVQCQCCGQRGKEKEKIQPLECRCLNGAKEKQIA